VSEHEHDFRGVALRCTYPGCDARAQLDGPRPISRAPEAFELLLDDVGAYSTTDETMKRTPERAAAAWRELTHGMRVDRPDLTTFDAEGADELVVIANNPLVSLCEHHLLPFSGYAHVAYIPNGRILGLSKFPRLIDWQARRLSVQERLTQQIARSLCDVLEPVGLLVMIEATHSCMTLRGARVPPGTITTTNAVRGVLKDKPEARAEALALIRRS
jgi:GTP cyclohydrolase IA